MTTLGPNYLTLSDWAKTRDPDGKTAVYVDLLSQTNEILDDVLWRECNKATSHETTVMTGLPTVTWRQLYQGVQPSKSTKAKIIDTCGMLEAFSVVDQSLADLEDDQAQFRLEEGYSFIESMSQTMSSALMYSNALATPEQIMGLSPRYSTVDPTVAQTANNVIDAGGVGSTNASIWLGVWGPLTGFGLLPKGSKAGLTHEDLGKDYAPAYDANNRSYKAYWDHYKWDAGLTVRDWRYFARICNIDVTLLGTAGAANLINALIRLVNRIPTMPAGVSAVQKTDDPRGGMISMGRPAIYVNRVIRTYLEIQALNKFNVLLKLEEWDGKTILTFRGVPIRTVDSLLSTEARVV